MEKRENINPENLFKKLASLNEEFGKLGELGREISIGDRLIYVDEEESPQSVTLVSDEGFDYITVLNEDTEKKIKVPRDACCTEEEFNNLN